MDTRVHEQSTNHNIPDNIQKTCRFNRNSKRKETILNAPESKLQCKKQVENSFNKRKERMRNDPESKLPSRKYRIESEFPYVLGFGYTSADCIMYLIVRGKAVPLDFSCGVFPIEIHPVKLVILEHELQVLDEVSSRLLIPHLGQPQLRFRV